MFLIFLDSGWLWIILILLEDIDNLDRDRMYSNYSTESEQNLHFSAFEVIAICYNSKILEWISEEKPCISIKCKRTQ